MEHETRRWPNGCRKSIESGKHDEKTEVNSNIETSKTSAGFPSKAAEPKASKSVARGLSDY